MSRKAKARFTKRKNHKRRKRQEYEKMARAGKTWPVG